MEHPANFKKRIPSTFFQNIDFRVVLFEKARKIGFSGTGLNQKGNHAIKFVHLDTMLYNDSFCAESGLGTFQSI